MVKLAARLESELKNWSDRLPRVWKPLFKGVELDFDAVDSNARLRPEEKIWPQETGGPRGAHLFRAFWDLRPEAVRVVVFGNDPYTRLEQATGRSFEQGNLGNWRKDIRVRGCISPSLKSILAAAAATTSAGRMYPLVDRRVVYDLRDENNPYGESPVWIAHLALEIGLLQGAIQLPPPKQLFSCWAKQGVLWINRTLTFTKWDDVKQPGHRQSHQMLWRPFTNRVLEVLTALASRKQQLVFALWGSEAKEMGKEISKMSSAGRRAAIRLIDTGHPQWAEGYFGGRNPPAEIDKTMNPLLEINKVIQGPPIRWA